MLTDAIGAASTSNKTGVVSQPKKDNNKINDDKSIMSDENDSLKEEESTTQKTFDEIENILSGYGLKPKESHILLLASETYSRNGYDCMEYEHMDGTKTVTRTVSQNFAQKICNAVGLTGKEKYIEEFDKQGNMTKQIHFEENGDYCVSNFDSEGKIESEADVNLGSSFTDTIAEVDIKEYNEDEAYKLVTKTYSGDDETDFEDIKIESKEEFYDKENKKISSVDYYGFGATTASIILSLIFGSVSKGETASNK